MRSWREGLVVGAVCMVFGFATAWALPEGAPLLTYLGVAVAFSIVWNAVEWQRRRRKSEQRARR